MNDKLPPGQQARDDFPRFGLTPFAHRFPSCEQHAPLAVSGDVVDDMALESPLAGISSVEQMSDFHCVTTWSHRGVRWGGVRFADFYRERVEPRLHAGARVQTVVARGQDGYRTTLQLSDLLADEVLLADRLDGQALTVAHGAPLRLVLPAHYGYKSVKHLSQLEFWQGKPKVRPPAFAFMDHPRARVAFEERGRWVPGWLLRLAYRPLVRGTAERFAQALARHQKDKPPRVD